MHLHLVDDFGYSSEGDTSPTIRPLNIPTTNIIPPTLQTAASYVASGTGASVPSTLNDPCATEAIPQSSAPSTPSRGRRSAEVIKVLEEGYKELEVILEQVASRTSLSTQQVAESWHKNRGRIINGSNYWNIYESYFKAYEDEERNHIAHVILGTLSLGEQWKEILEVFELTKMTKSLDQTVCQRSQTFNKIRRKILQILDIAAAKHGFQAAIVMCGNIVNEDMSLAFQHTTRGAIGFWGSQCRAHPETMIGHLKAHVYDDASSRIVEEAFKDEMDGGKVLELPRNNTQTLDHVEDTEHAVQALHASGNHPSPSSSEFEPSMDEGNPSNRIKESLTKLVERCGVDTSKLKGNNFPWKTLLSFLAGKSLVLEGYPHGVLMPGQSRHEGMRTKGINDLTLAEKRQLWSAIKGKRLTIRRADRKELCDIVNNTAPVILGEAPPMSSHDSHGQRMFANGTCDSKGLPHPSPGVAATRVKRSKPQLPTQDQDTLEITDTSLSSPPPALRPVIVENSRKSSRTLPIVIPSSSESNSPEPQPRKRKAAAPPAPHTRKKRGQEVRPTNARDKAKGAAVRGTRIKKITTSADLVDSSDDEIDIRDGDALCPKPRLKKPSVKIPVNDVFQDIEEPASSDLEEAISTSLRKRFEGPLGIPEAPPSPSPSPRPSLSLPPPLPLEQSSLPLLPKQKARPTPVLPSAPLPEPPTVGDATVPTPVLQPYRQEMTALHLPTSSHPHAASGDLYQTHPPGNMNNYYPHGNYNQHAAYPPYYGMPHAPVPPAPHAPIPPLGSQAHMHNLPAATHAPLQQPAPCAPIPSPCTDPRGYHDASNPSYPHRAYQYPGMFRAPNDGPTAGGYRGEFRDGAVDHRGYLSDLLVHDSTNIGMSYQHTGPLDTLQSTLPILPPAPCP
ncbi:hypothetical protein JVU11DRAFT_10782 [Chiua virens]|nr:hypothetical protein JVU11DRAFT_10782 [Chiua virens]